MSAGRTLAGQRVLVTRPAERAAGLLERIAEAGGEAIPFPVIEIVPRIPARLPDATAFAILLFVSPAAVEHGVAALGLVPGSRPPPAIGAVGPATTRALQAGGLRVDIRAHGGADSETLLEHPALQPERIGGRRILVVRGQGGREYLGNRLVERGATVEYAEVYRRERPSRYDPDRVADCDIVTATSAEGVDNLLAMLAPAQRQHIRQCPLAVAAPRIAEHARARGFAGPVVSAAQAGDEGLMTAIFECADRSGTPS
ncbi:MAG: uroporphyrinogen-III synthase [Halofilum sp. (in: g-proteobacteria)]|nr:uroporphyrinogen-III synthase [Halofilum sp. (in: g-proteobacteria)]